MYHTLSSIANFEALWLKCLCFLLLYCHCLCKRVRHRQLESILVVTQQFHETLEPLSEWLGATEKHLINCEPIGTEMSKLEDQISQHKVTSVSFCCHLVNFFSFCLFHFISSHLFLFITFLFVFLLCVCVFSVLCHILLGCSPSLWSGLRGGDNESQ